MRQWTLEINVQTSSELNTLFNIVEAWLKKKKWIFMSLLYNDVQMDQ